MQENKGQAPSLKGQTPSALTARIEAAGGILPLPDFIEWALYDPEHGYYRAERRRVGRAEGTDFYTASSTGSVFSRLVTAAAARLVEGAESDHAFVEIGPESAGGLLAHLPEHPFATGGTIRPGDELQLPPKCIVFSNEIFDAQPFRRIVYNDGQWREMGVTVARDGALEWAALPGTPEALLPSDLPDTPAAHLSLPLEASEGYTLDWPSGAHDLLRQIVAQPWQGLFLAFDYGHDSQTLLQLRPEGTGRTYARHRMGTELLESPGQRDITCHVAWDILEAILREAGFAQVQLFSQEAFLVKFGAMVIREIVEAVGTGFSRERQSLMELLHPANMGRKFQVLIGRRYSI